MTTSVLHRLLGSIDIERPYDWQYSAFEAFLAGEIPDQIKVPTAAGKTLILPIWVAALAAQASCGQVTLQRRLVHVVNRRILVDEASTLARRVRAALDDPQLADLREALAKLSAGADPLAVSSLRGGIHDDGAWSEDPSTPALVLATPDMVGSRLLFRGYGLGRARGASHAGLLGCDTLIIHDEAHLAPAFTSLLRQVEALAAPGAQALSRPRLKVVEMTATLSATASRPLVCDVARDDALRARMSAPKKLSLVQVAPSNPDKPQAAIVDEVSRLAVEAGSSNLAVAIFVTRPQDAASISRNLLRAKISEDRIVTLTGTLRGHEREAIHGKASFRRFSTAARSTDGGTAYFIATAAGEIGLDIDADLGLFDLTTLDRFIQRGGRINRRGAGVGHVVLVHASGDELAAALRPRCRAALDLLATLPDYGPNDSGLDASPLALSRLGDDPRYADAASPPIATRALEPMIVQMLAMTSLRLDELRCPPPEIYIHGLVDDEAQIQLAWRSLPVGEADFTTWLEAWPLVPSESAKLPRKAAQALLRHRFEVRKRSNRPFALVLDSQGQPVVRNGCVRADSDDTKWIWQLRSDSIVLLDTLAGGLDPQGLPHADATEPVLDVSVGFVDGGGLSRADIRQFEIKRSQVDDSARWSHGDVSASSLEALLGLLTAPLEIIFHDGGSIDGACDVQRVTVWLADPGLHSADAGELAANVSRDRMLEEHLTLTARAARRLVDALGMPSPWAGALVRAGRMHDLGKAWPRWQRAVGNHDAARVLGKTGRRSFDHRVNDGYRHELGSIVDEGVKLTELERHLVATHHGYGRPTYRASALDKPGCADVATAVAHGYARWTGELGPWSLAYLEALLKASDLMAETHADELLAENDTHTAPSLMALPAEHAQLPTPTRRFVLPVELANFGEVLAALGLAGLVMRKTDDIRLGWRGASFVIQGVDEASVAASLRLLVTATIETDTQATSTPEIRDLAYPPLRMSLGDGTSIALNAWLDASLREASNWKLGAGRTSALKTLQSVILSCRSSLDLAAFAPERLLAIGSHLVGGDASRFRFDARTAWSAREAGFSLNEGEHFKSTRPWVELLSTIGLQAWFAPPADLEPAYYTWEGMLPPPLALAALRGLLPCSGEAMRPEFRKSGKMTDVFPSIPVPRLRSSTCPRAIRIL